jgi:hypothetical protein
VTALSGMTVMSDVTTNNNFKICDTDNSKKNCIDMSITKEGVFNIAPIADFGDKVNNINTINILNKDNKKLLNIDLKTENIFLGGDKDEAGMMIHNDKVFVKKLNLLHPNKNFTDDKFYANKNTYLQNANEVNTYEFDIMDTKYQKDVLINIPCNYWIETEVKTTTPPSGTDTSTIREIKKIIIQLRIDNYTFFPLGLNAGTIIRIPIYHLAVPTTDIKNDGLVNLDINMRSKVKLSFEGLVQGKQNIIICETLTNIDYLDVLNIVLENTNNIFALDKKYDNIEPLFSTFNAYIVNM